MKIFKVQAHYVVYLDTQIEVDDNEDPYVVADKLAISDFDECADYILTIENLTEITK
jgi:hypothetical protein